MEMNDLNFVLRSLKGRCVSLVSYGQVTSEFTRLDCVGLIIGTNQETYIPQSSHYFRHMAAVAFVHTVWTLDSLIAILECRHYNCLPLCRAGYTPGCATHF